MSELPEPFVRFNEQFPDVSKAYAMLGGAIHEGGPLDAKTRQLVKLGMAIAAGSEGAVHAHTRRSLEAGLSKAEIYQAMLLAITTVGFPATVAAYTWINDILDAKP